VGAVGGWQRCGVMDCLTATPLRVSGRLFLGARMGLRLNGLISRKGQPVWDFRLRTLRRDPNQDINKTPEQTIPAKVISNEGGESYLGLDKPHLGVRQTSGPCINSAY